ncbi:MAG: polysaccharide pyruvyl transferase family protein [Candidatus Omnitrophica bacterium]|nr:polysaccharide pyruvyl transferase family protein [Candidatus Omnitrophota bacterium]
MRLLFRDVKQVACLDFPQSSNVGDNAIWLGQHAVLRYLRKQVAYQCDNRSYSKNQLKRQIGDGTILIAGGGNFGDLWPQSQRFREQVIQDFPENRIIQMPQSIYFRNRENLERAKKCINGHQNFVLLVRDQKSYAFAKNEFTVETHLCPDLAFGIELQNGFSNLGEKIILLSREDVEGKAIDSTDVGNNGSQIEKIDWSMIDRITPFIRVNQILSHSIHNYPKAFSFASSVSSLFYDGVSERRFRRACDVLRTARVVITNRLHGHILCLLLGIPHICIDNTLYGKIQNFYDTWTKDSPITFWANSADEAVRMAHEIVRDEMLEKVGGMV